MAGGGAATRGRRRGTRHHHALEAGESARGARRASCHRVRAVHRARLAARRCPRGSTSPSLGTAPVDRDQAVTTRRTPIPRLRSGTLANNAMRRTGWGAAGKSDKPARQRGKRGQTLGWVNTVLARWRRGMDIQFLRPRGPAAPPRATHWLGKQRRQTRGPTPSPAHAALRPRWQDRSSHRCPQPPFQAVGRGWWLRPTVARVLSPSWSSQGCLFFDFLPAS